GWYDEEQNKIFLEQSRQEVLNELKRVEKVPICKIDEIINDVYDTPPWHLNEQLAALKAHIAKYPDAYPKTAGRL
ncbi:MAG: thiamine pyrophosphate-dependent dehydrogenase E1 component subunit alpha, partial [Paraglaciecola sp.]|nr:thiamine pyrophosphate-dependent dehydrogenase E1 component subunit alpha [Paraglaciecola sp.]